MTTDIIVGFPGETEDEFEESLQTCRESAFARIHVFSYSSRPGTGAETMPDQVPETVKKERSRRMQELADASARRFREKFMGREMQVLFEQRDGGTWTGYTGNYIKVYVKSSRDLGNELLPVRITKIHRDGVWGELPG